MLEITGARSQDARALTAAILLGSLAGGLLGATYLGAVRPMRPVPRVATMAAPVLSAPSAVAQTVAAPRAAAAPSVAAPVGIAPFRFAAVARGTSDLQCLTEAVYFEARGEPDRGQQAVAQVVLNRVRHPAFPKTICAVVHQRSAAGCQFSFACAPQPAALDETAWTRARDVAKGALHGAVMLDVGDATHFESVRAMAFAGLLKVARIGEHVFYRFGGHDGGAGMFRQTPAPSTVAPKLMLASAEPAAPTNGPLPATSPAVAPPSARLALVAAASQTPAPPSKPAAAPTAPMTAAAVLIPAAATTPTVTPTAVKTATSATATIAS